MVYIHNVSFNVSNQPIYLLYWDLLHLIFWFFSAFQVIVHVSTLWPGFQIVETATSLVQILQMQKLPYFCQPQSTF